MCDVRGSAGADLACGARQFRQSWLGRSEHGWGRATFSNLPPVRPPLTPDFPTGLHTRLQPRRPGTAQQTPHPSTSPEPSYCTAYSFPSLLSLPLNYLSTPSQPAPQPHPGQKPWLSARQHRQDAAGGTASRTRGGGGWESICLMSGCSKGRRKGRESRGGS